MTDIQKRALAVLVFHWPNRVRPRPEEIVSGCYTAGLDGASPTSIAESMNLWRDRWRIGHPPFTARTVGRLLRALVDLGFVARVFVLGERDPRYVATAAGEEALQRADVHPNVWQLLATHDFRSGKRWIRYEGSNDGLVRLLYLIKRTRQIHVRFHDGLFAGWATSLQVADLDQPGLLVAPIAPPVPLPQPLGAIDVE